MVSKSANKLLGLAKTTDVAHITQHGEHRLSETELKLRMAELIKHLADASLKCSQIYETLHLRKQEIIDLIHQLEANTAELIWQAPFYYRQKDDIAEGPFCPRCWDRRKLFSRIKQLNSHYHCSKCGDVFPQKPEENATPELTHAPPTDYVPDWTVY